MKVQRIETTIGDLICAIQDAAKESCVDETEITNLTHMILMDLLNRNNTLNA